MNFITKYRTMLVITTILSVVIIGLVTTLVYGYFTQRPPCMKKSGRLHSKCTNNSDKHLLKLLNLNKEQSEFFLKAKSEFQLKHDSIGCLIHDVSRAIIGEVMSDTLNQHRIDQLTMEFCELQRQQKKIMISHIANVKQMLNSEQKEIFCRMMNRMDRPKIKNRHKQSGNHIKTCDNKVSGINF